MKEQQALEIICLQTNLTQYHYQAYPILKDYFLQRIYLARKSSSNDEHPIVVILPECTGTWLYLMCVPMPRFLRNYFFNYYLNNNQINRHRLFIIYTLITHIRLFCKEIYQNYHSKSTWLGLITRSWFTLFAQQTYSIYQKLFSELACETNSIIVAGSIFRNENNLYNMSYVFEPKNGSICLQSGKQYPVDDEIHFIDRYPRQPSIYSIPNTNIDISVLICADSWMPEIYNQIEFNSNRRFLLIIIALNTGKWNIPWPGYDIHVNTPNDVKNKHLSLSEAWFDYAINRGFEVLDKRTDLTGYGVVCCQGILNIMNDIQAQGESIILLKRSMNESKILIKAQTFTDEKILTCEF
jgi:hypothetical protein